MVLSMERWEGKVAVVTGASVGIGAAIAEELVDAGVLVVGLARRSEKIQKLANKLIGKKGKLFAVQTDLVKEEDIINAFKWTTENVGPVHILINNAGLAQQTNLIEGDTAKWKNVFDINVVALCIATREAVKIMRQNNIDGHIVHINSMLGHKVLNIPGMNVYPASKYAVTALTETLRQELNQFGTKIKITSVSPGLVSTEFTDVFKSDFFSKQPSLKADDVSSAVMYTLSTPPHVQVHDICLQPLNTE